MKRALVLCGGGSLGAYEVGAWRYLKEKGIDFDIVTGTSIGAINGAMVTMDAYEECVRLWEEVTINTVMTDGFNISESLMDSWKNAKDGNLKKIIGGYIKNKGVDITPFKELVKRTIDPRKIKNAPRTLGVVTTDYRSRKEVDIILNNEPEEMILPWLHASSACWPIFPMEMIKGRKYIDGGFVNNLPIDLAIKLGADEIVAVLLHAFPKEPQHPELMECPFVTCIRPSRDTGSILYFESHTLQNNMMLGYLDAMKAYNDAWGFSYCFKKDPKAIKKAEEVAITCVKENVYHSKAIRDSLFSKDMPRPKEAIDFYIRGLELLASAFELNPYIIWDIDDIQNEILSHIKKRAKELGEVTDPILKKNIRKKDVILVRLYSDIINSKKTKWLEPIIIKKPHVAYLKSLLTYLLE